MKINTQEINGFKIDQFNQHNLEEGKAQGICPLCSHERKGSKQKLKCASYDWKRGLGTCHNCNNTFQLHSYLRKGKVEKQYIRPQPNIQNKIKSTKIEQWFKSRGISKETLNDLKVSEEIEFMPQINKKTNAIKFNYYIGNELINIKYRDARKNFKLYKGAEKIFYNINSIININECYIVEGEMDALSLHESGLPNVVSVPNGATLNNNNLDYLDNCIDYFEDKTKIILATDTDEAGLALQQELITRFGAEI